MQAVILAAGQGKRLLPLTSNKPKALIEIAGKPLLQIIIEQLKAVGVTDIIIVVHHFKEKIIGYFGDGSRFGVRLTFVDQKERKGNADAVTYVEPFVREDTFLLLAVDSLFETDLLRRLLNHTKADGVFTCKEVEDTSRYGTVAVEGKRVVKIVEKSLHPPSKLANFSVYVLPREIIKECKRVPLSPRGEYELTDAIQALIDGGAVFEYEISNYIIDIGTPEQLQEAHSLIEKLSLKSK